MNFGHFDDFAKEYVIETPYTPLPWINYLGDKDFFSLISNTAGGYSFYKDAKLMRLTRFRYNNVPADGGRYYYICDGDTVFSPAFMPARVKLDSYKCRHGLGYTVFESSKNGLSATLECFVPKGDPCEINRLIIKNELSEAKTIKIYGAIEWCLWNAVDDSTNFQRNLSIGEVETEKGVVYHKTEYRERRNHFAFFAVNDKTGGFDTDRDTFLGRFNGWSEPAAVANRTNYSSIASGWCPIACHSVDFTLAPNETRSLIFMLGYAENKQEEKFTSLDVINKAGARKLINKYSTDESVNCAFTEIKEYWNALLRNLNVNTGDKHLDRMVNIWNQYQCMVTFNMSRSASYFESGTGRGMGFRDSCQDLLGFVHLIPERSRERILDIAAIQFEDGSTYHQYQPLTKRGNGDVGSGFNDDPLWLVACTAAYIKETGDSAILSEPTPFNNVVGSEKPLFEHLRRSVRFVMNNKGSHNLPLIGRADWNDCLNLNCFSRTPGESFQTCSNYESGKAESVFIAAMFVKYGREYAELCYRFGDKDESDSVLAAVADMEKAIIEFGWDGEWFLRAYDAFENKVGSKECKDGKIFIEPQGFCSMANVGGSEMAKKALASVDKYLVNDYGIELLAPCYKEYHVELGEISSYPRGYKENGSVFCHNNPWIVLAHATHGNANRAYELYMKTCPSKNESISEIHLTEPYVYSQTIASREAQNYGQAKNSWLTGTASWSMVACSQGILGICADYDGLRISPCLPDSINGFTAKRIFRGTLYDVTVLRDAKDAPYIELDGKKIEGNLIPAQTAQSVKVTVHIA